jgi:integrase
MGRSVECPPQLKGEKSFRWFAEEDPDGFRKRREQRWQGSTPEWYTYIMKKILVKFGDSKLKDIREQDLQGFLNGLADQEYSQSVVKNTRLYMRAVLAEAVEVGILAVNTAARLSMPPNTRKPKRPWLSVEQFQQVIAATESMRDRLMMKILYIGGVRRGELFGFQWHDLDDQKGILHIERQILENLTVGPAKTDGSIAPISIPDEIVADLIEWRKWAPNAKPDGWIFSSPRGAHINPGMWRRKVLVPAGNAVGIAKLNYHMFRRGFATEANAEGMNDKVIQSQLRHSSVNTTRDVYMQNVPSVQHAAIEKFTKIVMMPPRKSA